VEQQELDLLGGPPGGGHRGDVQPLVDLGPAGVVDPGDDLLHVVVLPGHPRRDDVGVVAVGHGHERAVLGGLLDPGFLQDVAVEPDPYHGLGLESGRQPVEGLGPLVDDCHRVAGFRQLHGQRRTHPPATEDHDVHGGKPSAGIGWLHPVGDADQHDVRLEQQQPFEVEPGLVV
jgi:hypothetical protein